MSMDTDTISWADRCELSPTITIEEPSQPWAEITTIKESSQTLASLNNVGCVIDFDGFQIGNIFLVKEMGIAYTYKPDVESYLFKVGNFYNLSVRDQKYVAYTKNHIHGMLFRDEKTDLNQNDLYDILKQIHSCCVNESNKPLIAFKGGAIEQQVLMKLDLPYLDLHMIGCPKFEELYNGDNYGLLCNLHKYIRKDKLAHCPKVETFYFKEWCLSCLK